MKTIAIAAALGLATVSTAAAERIYAEDIYLRYTLSDASIFAGAGGPLVVYGQPNGGATAEEIAADIRLPNYLNPNKVTAAPQGTEGYRLVLVFAPSSGLSGEKVCAGEAKGGAAGSRTIVLGVFCRSESTVLSEATLQADGAFAPGQPGFQKSMKRFIQKIMPRRNPLDDGPRPRIGF